ncbi:11645_t:CDS:2, partial [Ambispora leptoticha]
TEAEWKSEARSRGQASIQSYRSEYSTETETLWVEFTVLFDERRKREKRSPTKMYNALSGEIDLSPATLA